MSGGSSQVSSQMCSMPEPSQLTTGTQTNTHFQIAIKFEAIRGRKNSRGKSFKNTKCKRIR